MTASKTPSIRGRLWIFPRCRGRAWIVFLAVAITSQGAKSKPANNNSRLLVVRAYARTSSYSDGYLINEWHFAWTFFFFTRCIFSDIIRLNNLIFQVICRFRHLKSNIISFSLRYFSLKILLKSVMSFLEFRCRYFFDLKKKSLKHSAIHFLSIYSMAAVAAILYMRIA